MKRTPLKPFLWLTVLIGCSGLLTATPPVIGQTNSAVLWVQQLNELKEANQLDEQGYQLYQQGKYNEAIPLAERVLEIRERLLGENHPHVATSLNDLALLYSDQGRYDEAEPLYQRSLAIWEKALGENHPHVANSLNNLASLYSYQGRYDQAEPLIQRSLAIVEKALSTEHPDVASSLNNLALLYKSQGRYAEAEPLYQRSLAIYEKALSTEHPSVANSLNNLASLYFSQGRYNEAEPLYQRSLAIDEKALGENHPHVATSLNNLAFLYRSQGRYDQAEPLIQRSLAIAEKALGENHPDVASSLNNLASLYSDQGRYNDAEPLYQRSLAIYEKALGSEHPDVATSLNNLALLYSKQGRYNQAEPLYQRSLAIWEKALSTEHPLVATSLSNLANLYHSQGRYDEAEPLHQRSLSIWEKALGENHPSVALSLNNLALLYDSQGRYNQAEPLLQRSLAIYEKALSTEHPNVANSLNNLALLYHSQGDTTQAINFLSRGLDVQEQNLNVLLATGSERQKQDSMKTVYNATNFAVYLHIKDAPNNLEASRLALTTILRRKGRILDVMTDNLQLLRENITPENQQLLDELATVRTQLATFIYNKPENIPDEQYRQQVANLREKSEQLEAELSSRSAEFRTISEPVTIEAVQQLIPEDAALVEFVLYQPYDAKATFGKKYGKPHYAAYILKSSGEPQWVDLGEAEPIHRAAFFRFNLDLKDSKDTGNSDKVKQSGRKLDERLMQSIREKLGNVNHIIVSPDAQLNLIPFAALVDENNRYLIETYKITYLTTGRDLIRLQLEYSHKQAPVIVANPDYDKPGEPITVAVSKNSESSPAPKPPTLGALKDGNNSGDLEISPQTWGDRGGLSQTRGMNQLSRGVEMSFGALPGTAEEAKVIAPLLSDVLLLTQSQATENAVKQLDAPKIIHIATHGFFLPNLPRVEPDNTLGFISENTQQNTPIQENPLIRSGLALAGFNPRESGSDDGVLTALEVANLKLRGTKLVVLSACETGLGEIENGEGVYGLRRAFTLAGSESQLMSLWKVNDEGTKELMIKYYQRLLQNQGRSDAWRQTQLEMLNSQQYQHPYFWAAFVPIGDWTPMER
ncbi:CHAT domain-containing tetratricopeptide repeat protein [Limnoraphis robusta]|uniref:Tetratricopeptide repeat protein n=1 Tax=Limnoraphis robusta CCNP1315 TaxID=3110306 RepID=A0ABU5TVT6_9CYAN|nr:tetratricopeptide repeat protein [Limnoraphis robusta]MEA5519009.1 tetratricopeptide repeat protein [Limnoraphis robusta CCNP1315]MEA5544019.1 tetratricopeptide repeat protein [Limnoraphis robusta CCNP1324]